MQFSWCGAAMQPWGCKQQQGGINLCRKIMQAASSREASIAQAGRKEERAKTTMNWWSQNVDSNNNNNNNSQTVNLKKNVHVVVVHSSGKGRKNKTKNSNPPLRPQSMSPLTTTVKQSTWKNPIYLGPFIPRRLGIHPCCVSKQRLQHCMGFIWILSYKYCQQKKIAPN